MDKKFLKDNLKMVEKATKFLKKYLEDVITEKNEMHVSYDIWEMYEGVHLYSMASIYSSFNAMIKIYEELKEEFTKNRVKQEELPMNIFTPEEIKPSEKTLAIIRQLAYTYRVIKINGRKQSFCLN